MSFDDIPEDLRESFPCPNCTDGSVEYDNDTDFWECEKCNFKKTDMDTLN